MFHILCELCGDTFKEDLAVFFIATRSQGLTAHLIGLERSHDFWERIL